MYIKAGLSYPVDISTMTRASNKFKAQGTWKGLEFLIPKLGLKIIFLQKKKNY